MNRDIFVSVIMPVYNAEKYLNECLDSLIAQTVFNNLEIILIDDGSTDNSPSLCDTYAKKHENIKVVHQQNAGVSAARNCGIEKAQGKYIGFVDADDYLYPEMYERLYKLAEETGSDISFCGFFHPYPDKDVIITYPFEQDRFLGREYIRDIICPFMLRDSSLNSLWNKIYKRETITENSLMLRLGKKQGEDREFLLRVMAKSKGVCCSGYTGYYYRYVTSGAIQKPRCDYAETILEQYDLDFELFGALGMEKDEIQKIRIHSTVNEILCALAFADNKIRGVQRNAVMKGIIENERVRDLISGSRDTLMENSSNFNRLLLIMMKKKQHSRYPFGYDGNENQGLVLQQNQTGFEKRGLKMKKSLLFIMPSLSSGGAEKSLVTLLALLDYGSYDVDLFLFRKTGLFVSRIPQQVNVITAGEDYELFDGNIKKALKGFLKKGRPKYAVDRIKYSFALRKDDKKRDKDAWKYLSRVLPEPAKEYDAAIGYLEGTSIYFCVDKVRAKKKVGYLHTDYNRIITQKSMDEAYFEKLDSIVGVSQKCCDILTGIFPNLSKKTTVIENIISEKMISAMSRSEEKLFDADENETVILTIGRLSPPKGIGNAVLACARLIEMGYKIKWYQIGTGELKAQIEELVKEKGLEQSFIMLGERENPYPYIKQCGVYVQPSEYEGKAIAVDEVKCLKKPIVVTDFETVFDQIEDGVNGIIAKKEPEDIALKIKSLIDCPERCEELSENLMNKKTGNEEELEKFCSLINK